MMLEKLIVFVEEASMGAALEILLPKMLGNVEFQVIQFQCKDDLLKQLPARLRGYSSWLPESWSIFILLDRDDDDCQALKQHLEQESEKAGLLTKTNAAPGQRFQVANRIVIEELEAWYFGNWDAVKRAYPKVPATIPKKAAFRNPDTIGGGTWEALEGILKKCGYHSTGLRKIQCAKDVAKYMNPEQNISQSFNTFHNAINDALARE